MAERSIAAVLKTVDLRRSGGSNPSLSAKKQTASGRRKLAFGFPRSSVFARAFLAKDQGWTQSIPLSPPKDDSRKNRISPSGGVLFLFGKKYIVHDISCILRPSSTPRSAAVICQPSGGVIPTSYKRHWSGFMQLIY